jgi:ubiquinone biosynthesis accessory factor UbiJ
LIPGLDRARRGLESAINQALTLDPGSKAALAELAGKSLGVQSTFPPLAVTVRFLPDGELALSGDANDQPDVKLTGNPVALALLLAKAGETTSFANTGVTILGDQSILQALAAILQHLDIDWEHAAAGLIGDAPAHLAGQAVRSALNWQKSAVKRSATGVGDFLREESGMTIGKAESESWFTGVRLLAADTDRLAARLNRLNHLLEQRSTQDHNR